MPVVSQQRAPPRRRCRLLLTAIIIGCSCMSMNCPAKGHAAFVDIMGKVAAQGTGTQRASVNNLGDSTSRRTFANLALSILPAAGAVQGTDLPAHAESGSVFVAGATGNTGQRIVSELQKKGYNVLAGVRSPEKASKVWGNSGPKVVPFDVEKLDVDAMASALSGTKLVICATGFVPGNPFEMSKAAKAVDKEGTIRLVDAAKKAGVEKFVLISSILTNGRAIGQENNPGFVITNAFGGILDEKLVAEKYLKSSGLDFTILRPGGLRDKAPETAAVIGKEDTLLSGEVSRDLVAKVAVDSLTKSGAKSGTFELIEQGTCLANVQKCEELPAGQSEPAQWFS